MSMWITNILKKKEKTKEISKIMRLIGGVQGYSSKIFNPYVIIARRNSQPDLQIVAELGNLVPSRILCWQ